MKTLIVSALTAAIFAIAAPLAAYASEPLPNTYEARVISNYDGDTISVEVTVWVDQVLTTSVRVEGIDTPEIRGKCPEERVLAIKAKDRVFELVSPGLTLKDVRWGKYARRVVADVYLVSGERLADVLIAEGLGRFYDGGTRQPWCED